MKTWLSFARIRGKYLDLKDTEEGERAISFGVRGIVCALFAAACVALCYVSFGMTKQTDITSIFGIVLLIVGAAATALFLLFGIFTSTLQIKLNRRAIGYVSLVLQFAAIAAAVVVVIVVNNG